MADEQNSLEIDDWLDDLEDDKSGESEEALGELDQSDIDALLGGGDDAAPAAEAQAAPPKAAEDSGDELDQSDIDSLLGGGDDAAPAAAAAPADAGDDDFSELDQSDIDSLLGGAGDSDESVPADASAEIDQSDIDSLLGGAGESDESAPAADASSEIDQSDIDDLFAAASDDAPDAAAPVDEDGGEPSQDDVDQLFSEVGATESEEETLGAETVSFTEMLNEDTENTVSGDDESFGLPDDTGFDDDEFDFGELPDIPDETTTGMTQASASDDIFGDEGTSNELDELLADNDAATQEITSPNGGKGLPFALPVDMNKKVMAMTGMCLVLLLAGGGYFLFKGKKVELAVPVLLQEQQLSSVPVGKPVTEEAAVNVAPMVADAKLKMVQAGEALSIELSGTDENNDPLQFEVVTPPKHGRLSGDVPNLTYLPNKNFPGEDSFAYRALDGMAASAPATVSILGVQTTPKLAEKPMVVKSKRFVVAAKNVRLKTVSTTPLEIDWRKIWKKANNTPFNAKVAVEIVDKDVRGKLTKVNRSKHRYEPDKYFGGSEIISYRFRYAKATSKVRQLLINVELGDPSPEIRLQPMAKAYPVGGSVVLDAGLTKDDSSESLIYSWEQLAGVPVHMVVLNDDASAISFVVPSSFYRQDIPKTMIRVTAIDQSGQRASKDIAIPTVSRRQTALWRGSSGGGLEYEPHCPSGECPGALLPWPYAD